MSEIVYKFKNHSYLNIKMEDNSFRVMIHRNTYGILLSNGVRLFFLDGMHKTKNTNTKPLEDFLNSKYVTDRYDVNLLNTIKDVDLLSMIKEDKARWGKAEAGQTYIGPFNTPEKFIKSVFVLNNDDQFVAKDYGIAIVIFEDEEEEDEC